MGPGPDGHQYISAHCPYCGCLGDITDDEEESIDADDEEESIDADDEEESEEMATEEVVQDEEKKENTCWFCGRPI